MADGTDEAYEAFAGLYPQTPVGVLARDWLNRHIRMVAWNNAVIVNTASSYRSFLTKFPDSDLTATARKLEQRLRNRPEIAPVVAGTGAAPQNVALTCPCNNQPAQQPQQKKADTPKRTDPDPPKRVDRKPPRIQVPDDDVVVYRRPPPVYERAPPVGVGIGIGIGGGGYGGGGYGGGGYGGGGYGGGGRDSGYVGQGRSRGGY